MPCGGDEDVGVILADAALGLEGRDGGGLRVGAIGIVRHVRADRRHQLVQCRQPVGIAGDIRHRDNRRVGLGRCVGAQISPGGQGFPGVSSHPTGIDGFDFAGRHNAYRRQIGRSGDQIHAVAEPVDIGGGLGDSWGLDVPGQHGLALHRGGIQPQRLHRRGGGSLVGVLADVRDRDAHRTLPVS